MGLFGKFIRCAFCFFIILLTGCTKSGHQVDQEDGRPLVVSTTAIIGDMVFRLGGKEIQSVILIAGPIDPHSYEVVKGDREKLLHAALVVSSGLGLEHGASLRSLIKNHPMHLSVGDTLPKESIIIDQGVTDPHFWMDLSLMARCIDPIAAALAAIDPPHAALYQQRATALKAALLTLDKKIITMMHAVPGNKRYLLTSHDSFNYYTRRYLATESERVDGAWKERFEAPEGLAPESQIRLSQIKNILTYIKKHDVHVLFPESNLSQESLKKIVDAAAQENIALTISKDPLYADTLGDQKSSAFTYTSMLLYDAKTLYQGWMGEQFLEPNATKQGSNFDE